MHLSIFILAKKIKIFNFLSCTWYCFLLSFNISAWQFSDWGGGDTHISTRCICTYTVHTWLSNAAETCSIYSAVSQSHYSSPMSAKLSIRGNLTFWWQNKNSVCDLPPRPCPGVTGYTAQRRKKWSFREPHPAWKSHWESRSMHNFGKIMALVFFKLQIEGDTISKISECLKMSVGA